MKTCPPMVRDAVLDAFPVLAATLNDTDPGPMPLEPAVTYSQVLPPATVQLQADPVTTFKAPDPPQEE